MKRAVSLTLAAMVLVPWMQTARAASGGGESREAGSSPPQIQPARDADRTPENVTGYDTSPRLLDIVWETRGGRRLEGVPVRVGSRTLTVRSRGGRHRLAIDLLTEPCVKRARAFQVMGRIEPRPLPEDQRKELAAWRVRSYRYTRTLGHSIDFLLYAPDDGRPVDAARPLLLFLCDSGGCGTDNFRQWTDAHGVVKSFLTPEFQRRLRCYVMIPQSDDPENAWADGGAWFPKSTLGLAVQAMDALKAGPAPQIDMKRLYLTGLSAGAYGCFQAMENFPGKFAAVVPVQGGTPYSFVNRENARPTWMVFNGNEEAVASSEANELARRFKTLHVDMRQQKLPGNDFDIWTTAYQKPAFRIGWPASPCRG